MGRLLEAALRFTGIVLYHLGLAPFFIWLGRLQPKVLLYHACEPGESEFTRGLRSNTTPAEFERHLAFLKRRYHVISLGELEHQYLPERTVVITFDDGYRSVLEHAFP